MGEYELANGGERVNADHFSQVINFDAKCTSRILIGPDVQAADMLTFNAMRSNDHLLQDIGKQRQQVYHIQISIVNGPHSTRVEHCTA